MAIYGRQKNDFTFHFMDRVSFSTGFWGFGESMKELNGKLLLPETVAKKSHNQYIIG